MLTNVRNIAIIALLALAITVLPGGGNLVEALLTALTITFLAAIALLGARTWQQTEMTRDLMSDRQRGIVYGSLGAIALMIAGLDEMFATGGGTVAWLLIVGVSGYLLFITWREVTTY